MFFNIYCILIAWFKRCLPGFCIVKFLFFPLWLTNSLGKILWDYGSILFLLKLCPLNLALIGDLACYFCYFTFYHYNLALGVTVSIQFLLQPLSDHEMNCIGWPSLKIQSATGTFSIFSFCIYSFFFIHKNGVA